MHLRFALSYAGLVIATLAVAPSCAELAHTGPQNGPRMTAPLVFGIYPGAAVGTVGPSGQTRRELPQTRQQALRRLRGSAARPFVLHLYDSYTRPSDAAAVPPPLASQIADYTADGFRIEVVLAYRPADRAADVAGYTAFARARVRQLASNPGVADIQVTNEANVTGAPNAADGAYAGVRRALVRGVIATKRQARRAGREDLQIGFNWAYQRGPAETAFFTSLRRAGGSAFADAVDWVGLDAYPGTWGPRLPRGDRASAIRRQTLEAIRMLRRRLMPRAGLSKARLHISESGYPTGRGRSEGTQRTVLRTVVRAVSAARAKYGVTDYRWFGLRDSYTAAPSFESHYGLMRDDYSPKPAFSSYRRLIARLGEDRRRTPAPR